MEHDRPRWRFRLSTLVLLVIILALALTLVIDRWEREQERRLRPSGLWRRPRREPGANAPRETPRGA
jgi:hypothetical protein